MTPEQIQAILNGTAEPSIALQYVAAALSDFGNTMPTSVRPGYGALTQCAVNILGKAITPPVKDEGHA